MNANISTVKTPVDQTDAVYQPSFRRRGWLASSSQPRISRLTLSKKRHAISCHARQQCKDKQLPSVESSLHFPSYPRMPLTKTGVSVAGTSAPSAAEEPRGHGCGQPLLASSQSENCLTFPMQRRRLKHILTQAIGLAWKGRSHSEDQSSRAPWWKQLFAWTRTSHWPKSPASQAQQRRPTTGQCNLASSTPHAPPKLQRGPLDSER